MFRRVSDVTRSGACKRRARPFAALCLAAAVVLPAVASCATVTKLNRPSGGLAPAGSGTVTAAAVTVTPSGAASTVPKAYGWTLKADDEFTTTSLRSSLWSVGEPWHSKPGFVQGDDAWCPLPTTGQVVVSGGALKLNAIARPTNGKPLQSCFVTTRNKFSFTHGYVEARVKLPSSPGLWPAFWMLGNGTGANGWPKTGEIDLFEFVNNGKDNGVPFFTVHWGGNCPGGHCQKTQDSPYPAKLANYAGQWVTYGMRRTASSLTIYINGKQTVQFLRTARNGYGQPLGTVLFDSPMHIRFDLSAGGWAKMPGVTSKPGTFAVDYLRVWS